MPGKHDTTLKEIGDAIVLFRAEWETDSMRNALSEDKEKSVTEEFYHGACHYFSSAIVHVLNTHGITATIFNLHAGEEFVHSVVGLPYILLDGESFPTFDIQSEDGRGMEQAEYVFCKDPFDNPCPLLDTHAIHAPEDIRWSLESETAMRNMLEDYSSEEKGNLNEAEYWRAVVTLFDSCLVRTMENRPRKTTNRRP